MEDQPISGKDFMKFMNNFKMTMEETVMKVEDNVCAKLKGEIENIDKGINILRKEVKENEKKTEDMNKMLTGRISQIEQDMRRLKHSSMKSDTLGVQPKGRRDQPDQSQDKLISEPRNATVPGPKENNCEDPARRNEGAAGITRQNSWADEVTEEMDRPREKHQEEEWRCRQKDKSNGPTKEEFPMIGRKM